jgi:hypothetical protein
VAAGAWSDTRDPTEALPADAVTVAEAVSRRGCADAMSRSKSGVGRSGAVAGAKLRERGSSWVIGVSSRRNLGETNRMRRNII